MNENIDLTKILKGCPTGTEFYHAGYGTTVKFIDIKLSSGYPIRLALHDNPGYHYANLAVTEKGTINADYKGECLLFPSEDQRDWSKFVRFWDKSEVGEQEAEKLDEEHEIKLPDGYIFKDENGNVINATKIVMEKKKKMYPKTYEECCKIIGADPNNFLGITNCYYGEVETTNYEKGLLNNIAALWYLRICRDAYWKIADDWKEKRKERSTSYVIYSTTSGEIVKCTMINSIANYLLDFPTEEMRDAFYENVKELIERCKELL